jgi:hypothetical protein
MKLYKRIESTIGNIKLSIKRFPITLIISVILVISLIYLQESPLNLANRGRIREINMILGLAIPLSVCIGLLIESFFKEDKLKSTMLYLGGTGFLILYYFIFVAEKDFNVVTMSRYGVVILSLVLAFLYIPRLKNNQNYEYYVMDVYSSLAITFIYSFVLYFGISAIFFTIDRLFDVSIKGDFYYYMFLIVSFIFALSLFLSKLPSEDNEFINIEYTKALKVLLLYIVIPLITIYTAILYVYFAKIIVTMVWPKGLVSHLVLWYSTISVGIIFLITPILEENKIAKLFKIWFPKVILPVLLMMFMSIGQRVGQYGITENRYYIMVLGGWVTGIMIYFSLKKPLKNIIIPISLSIIMLNSVFGPLSSYSLSKMSQNRRLENILNRNNMIDNNIIIPNPNVSKEDRIEINNIISYFDSNHEVGEINVFPKDTDIKQVDKLTGFKYEYYNPYVQNQEIYFFYGSQNSDDYIDITGYDYFVNLNSWNQQKRNIGDLTIEYNNSKNILNLKKNGEILAEQEILSLIEDIHEKQKLTSENDKGKDMLNYKDVTYEVVVPTNNADEIKLKIIFTNINGKVSQDDNLIIDGVDFMVLIKK